jgi:hypothetical protein
VIVGNPQQFAIESIISRAYAQNSLQALGFFVIHLLGEHYGVQKADATLLASSYDEVGRRILARGTHIAEPFAVVEAKSIARAFRANIYTEDQDESVFGLSLKDFQKRFSKSGGNLMWAPDGDEAFDDGSFVLQFDINDRVRLIGFRSSERHLYDSESLRDLWLKADEFYDVLFQWRSSFEAERAKLLQQ